MRILAALTLLYICSTSIPAIADAASDKEIAELKERIASLEAKQEPNSKTPQDLPAYKYTPPARSSGYIRGPRGGCYTYSASGNKRYVDRSMCN